MNTTFEDQGLSLPVFSAALSQTLTSKSLQNLLNLPSLLSSVYTIRSLLSSLLIHAHNHLQLQSQMLEKVSQALLVILSSAGLCEKGPMGIKWFFNAFDYAHSESIFNLQQVSKLPLGFEVLLGLTCLEVVSGRQIHQLTELRLRIESLSLNQPALRAIFLSFTYGKLTNNDLLQRLIILNQSSKQQATKEQLLLSLCSLVDTYLVGFPCKIDDCEVGSLWSQKWIILARQTNLKGIDQQRITQYLKKIRILMETKTVKQETIRQLTKMAAFLVGNAFTQQLFLTNEDVLWQSSQTNTRIDAITKTLQKVVSLNERLIPELRMGTTRKVVKQSKNSMTWKEVKIKPYSSSVLILRYALQESGLNAETVLGSSLKNFRERPLVQLHQSHRLQLHHFIDPSHFFLLSDSCWAKHSQVLSLALWVILEVWIVLVSLEKSPEASQYIEKLTLTVCMYLLRVPTETQILKYYPIQNDIFQRFLSVPIFPSILVECNFFWSQRSPSVGHSDEWVLPWAIPIFDPISLTSLLRYPNGFNLASKIIKRRPKKFRKVYGRLFIEAIEEELTKTGVNLTLEPCYHSEHLKLRRFGVMRLQEMISLLELHESSEDEQVRERAAYLKSIVEQ